MAFQTTIQAIGKSKQAPRIRPYLVFCREFAATGIIVTALCIGLIAKWGMGIFATLFFFKAAVIAITIYFIDSVKRREYYYYHNLGISKRRLWGTVTTADMLLFLILTPIATLL